MYMCHKLVYDVYRELDKPIAGGDYDCPTLTELNMACRGLLRISSKEHAKHNQWRKVHPIIGVDKEFEYAGPKRAS